MSFTNATLSFNNTMGVASTLLECLRATGEVPRQEESVVVQFSSLPQSTLDSADNGALSEEFVICWTNQMAEQSQRDAMLIQRQEEETRNFFLLSAAALVFFMQAGFAMVCAGAVRRKNLQNTMMKNLLDSCGASIAFYSIGYAFAFGDSQTNPNSFIGTTNFFLHDIDNLSVWLFQYTFSAATVTIVAGTLAERCKMHAYFCYSLFLSGIVYPIVAHAVWSTSGFLSVGNDDTSLLGVGVIDYAGSGVVHLTGGLTALIATWILGPRRGRFHDMDTGEPLEIPNPMPGHSLSLQMLGTFILWFGWYGFNVGSTMLLDPAIARDNFDSLAALAAVNTTLAAGMGGLVAVGTNLVILKWVTGEITFDLVYAMNGILSGLVSITAGCGVVEPWAAMIIGSLSGIWYLLGSWSLVWLRIDDAVDAVPVHFVNGMWGMIAVGFFASPDKLQQSYGFNTHPGWFYREGPRLLGAQWIGMMSIGIWTISTMLPFFWLLERYGLFRTTALDEVVGLDKKFYGGFAGESGDDGGGDGGGIHLSPEELTALQRRVEERMENSTTAGGNGHGGGGSSSHHHYNHHHQHYHGGRHSVGSRGSGNGNGIGTTSSLPISEVSDTMNDSPLM